MTTPNTETPLKIVRLTASNVMRLRAGIEIVPKGETVIVTGENGDGKSSVLNCILFALGGKKNLPPKPVRSGAAAADVHLDLGEIVIDWRHTAAGSVTLIVRTKDGGAMKSPQTALDSLWNQMCDPVRFVRLSDTPEGCRKQAEILRQIVNLDFTALDKERKELYEEREELGRTLKNSKGQLSALAFHADAPEKEVSASDLMTEFQKAETHNNAIEKDAQTVRDYEREIQLSGTRMDELDKEILELEKQITAKRSARGVFEENIDSATKAMDVLRQSVLAAVKIDMAPFQTRIGETDDINKKVRENASRREVETKVRTTQERIDVLTNQMNEIDEEKREKLAKAPFPVPGLAFDDTGIVLNNVPFSQGSQAEQLVAATAIALALKPRIRVVLLRDASLLDTKTRQSVAELAQREQAQVWEEVVESDDESAIVIEDGQVKEKE
jgi:DNA repair exonuclease SbcCD ATPase subunit